MKTSTFHKAFRWLAIISFVLFLNYNVSTERTRRLLRKLQYTEEQEKASEEHRRIVDAMAEVYQKNISKIWDFTPDASRPVMHTFLEPLGRRGVPGINEITIIAIWKHAWQQAGWNPRVLKLDDARKHPDFEKMQYDVRHFSPMMTNDYETFCYLRHLAMATVEGGGWMSDFDVMPLGLTVEEYGKKLPNDGQFTSYSLHVPALFVGNQTEWDYVAHRIWKEGQKHMNEINKAYPFFSDMLAFLDVFWGVGKTAKDHVVTVNADRPSYENSATPVLGTIAKALVRNPPTPFDCNLLRKHVAIHVSHYATHERPGHLPGYADYKRDDLIRPYLMAEMLQKYSKDCGGPDFYGSAAQEFLQVVEEKEEVDTRKEEVDETVAVEERAQVSKEEKVDAAKTKTTDDSTFLNDIQNNVQKIVGTPQVKAPRVTQYSAPHVAASIERGMAETMKAEKKTIKQKKNSFISPSSQHRFNLNKGDRKLPINRRLELFFVNLPQTYGSTQIVHSKLFPRKQIRGYFGVDRYLAREGGVAGFASFAIAAHPCERFVRAFEFMKKQAASSWVKTSIGDLSIDEFVVQKGIPRDHVQFRPMWTFLFTPDSNTEEWKMGVDRVFSDNRLGDVVDWVQDQYGPNYLLSSDLPTATTTNYCEGLSPVTRQILDDYYFMDYCIFGFNVNPTKLNHFKTRDMNKLKYQERIQHCFASVPKPQRHSPAADDSSTFLTNVQIVQQK